jgi:hypothetical protein
MSAADDQISDARNRMLGSVPGAPALGRGPAPDSRRTVYGYRAIRYEVPRGCAAGYMPELNVLCGIADYSTQSGQPVTKHLEVEVTPARATGAGQ